MSLHWPNPLTGGNPLATWLNRLRSAARQCEPLESKDFRIEFTSNGFFLRPKFQTTGGSPGKTLDANQKLMVITQLGSSLVPAIPDLLVCAPCGMSGVPTGPTVYVAKDLEARQSVTAEYFADNGDNVIQPYSYFGPTSADASYGDNFRLATLTINGGTLTELQVMEKRYVTKAGLPVGSTPAVPVFQALVYVIDTGAATGVKDPAGNDVTRLEVKPVRVWVKYASQ